MFFNGILVFFTNNIYFHFLNFKYNMLNWIYIFNFITNQQATMYVIKLFCSFVQISYSLIFILWWINLYYYLIIGHRANDFKVDGFSCPNFCGRNYKYKRNLVSHLKVECGKSPNFKCPFCEKTCFYKTHLRKHICCVHKIIVSW